MSLEKINPTLKTGEEQLHLGNQPINFSLLNFWQWYVSDLMSNATRGCFAEFIVATATNIDIKNCREEWSPYDLETIEGIKLEVKSCAYLQSWHQNSLSKISFSIKPAFHWDSNTNKYSDTKKRHADVYVFCLLHHEDKLTVDPMNLDQWQFYVLATKELNDYPRSQHSISLKSLEKLTKAITYTELHNEVIKKNAYNSEI